MLQQAAPLLELVRAALAPVLYRMPQTAKPAKSPSTTADAMSRDDYEYDEDEDQSARVDAARGVFRHHRNTQHMILTPLVQKIVAAVACACVVGGGTVVLNSREKIAVLEYASVAQDVRLQRIESKVDQLLDRK